MSRLDVSSLVLPPRLIVNPRAGRKLGLATNTATLAALEGALQVAGLEVVVQPTRSPGHAIELARAAVEDGCKLVIAAGGDGTVAEAAQGILQSDTTLGIMPLGSIMNMARALCIPRDLKLAARTIAAGQVLAMDAGSVANHLFLEAGGVGLAAGLFGYFNRLDTGVRPGNVIRAGWRFLRHLGSPRMVIVADGQRFDVRAVMVTVSNGPYVGAAYALAPQARLDDGLLDVVIYRGMGVIRVLLHMAVVAGGRRLPAPQGVQLVRAQTVQVMVQRHRPLPVHADGGAVGVTPARFQVLPAALRVIVGDPDLGAVGAWDPR
ncbi:MAG TPA: diacylglycerol kinase family protein [Chloroflexota bacterium]|nr:diacylglycerol kinase family protein [Chloroflexota bacterium]